MRLRPSSVRTRLTLWHAAVLTAIICAFSVGIFLFVRTRLSSDLELQLDRQLATVERIYREEPGELGDLDSHWGITLFQIVEPTRVVFRTEGWERGGVARALPSVGAAARASWTAPDGRRYRVGRILGTSYAIDVAMDERPLRHTLWTLAV